MKKIIYLSFIVIVACLACNPKPIKINVPQETPKLSVFSYAVQDGGILVQVTKTFTSVGNLSILSDTTEEAEAYIKSLLLVERARVTIEYDGNIDTLVSVGDGTYLTTDDFLFFEYVNYKLEVYDSVSGQLVTANSIVQPSVVLDTLIGAKSINLSDTVFKFDYIFKDDKTNVNYYMINVSSLRSEEEEIGLTNSFAKKPKSHIELISDQTQPGVEMPGTNIAIQQGSFSISTFKYDVVSSDTLLISISAIDKAYYEFLSVYKRNGSIINQLTGEPINLPTNVKNGYGYFSSHFANYSVFDLSGL